MDSLYRKRIRKNGVLSEIVTAAYEAEGIKVNIKFEPWKRVEINLDKDNSVDDSLYVSYGWIRNEERERKWHFSKPLFKGGAILASLKSSNFEWSTLNDLKPYKIGIARGYSYGTKFDEFKKYLKFESANEDIQNLKKLSRGRVDLVAIDSVVGARLINKMSEKDRNKIEFIRQPALHSYDLHLVCAKNSKQCENIIKTFNSGLDKIVQNGKKREIENKALSR
jgi:polar amino acid transport system substrate-binding protein